MRSVYTRGDLYSPRPSDCPGPLSPGQAQRLSLRHPHQAVRTLVIPKETPGQWAGGANVGCLLAHRAPISTLCNQVEALLRCPQDPGRHGFHPQHEGFGLDLRSHLEPEKDSSQTMSSGICQQPRWPCGWWEQDAGLSPGAEGAQGAFLPVIVPDTGPESSCSGGNPGVARHTFQSF